MDGYLDQQVPYTLANVRMDELRSYLCAFCLVFSGLFSLSVSRLHEFCAEAAAVCARLQTSFNPLKTDTQISTN